MNSRMWGKRALAGGVLALVAASTSAFAASEHTPRPPFKAIVVPGAMRDSMSAIFVRGNQHWNELEEMNTLTQMLGTGKPTQLEYMGCLQGHVDRDTLWITSWMPARDMKRFQFAVAGHCGALPGVVGTWHTHPYRADVRGAALKERRLSADDLATFVAGRDLALLAVWDVDSLDAAARTSAGIRHPAVVLVR